MRPIRFLSFLSVLSLLVVLAGPAALEASSCSPLTSAEWSAKCADRDGREEIRKLLPDLDEHRLLEEIDSLQDACELLVAGQFGSICKKARRQYLVAALNWHSDRIGRHCCFTRGGEEFRLIDELRGRGREILDSRDCEEARNALARLNNPGNLHECGDPPDGEPPDDDDDDRECCTPRSKGFWHRQCMGIGELEPHGGGHGPGLHPAFTEDELRRIVNRADRRMGDRAESACQALDNKNYGTRAGKALAQYAAVLLNAAAGFLDGCDGLRDDVREIERYLDAQRYGAAQELAEQINLGRRGPKCPDEDDDQGEDEDEDDDDGPPGQKKSKGKKKGKEK